MYEILEILGFTLRDALMLQLSALFGLLGCCVRAYILEGQLGKYESPNKTWKEAFTSYRDFQWYLYHAFVGFVTGLLVALLFIGAINDDKGAIARVLALALLMGYSAPTLWNKQEAILEKMIDKKINALMDVAK